MENYTKGKNVEESLERDRLPFKDLPQNFLWMQVKGGSRMANLLSHAASFLENKVDTVIVWTGAGVGLGKAITCAELTKREFKIPHQITRLTYKTDEEYWDPKLEGLEKIVVKRQIPVIHIMLSTETEFDFDQPGYQSLNGKKFWQGNVTDRSNQKGKNKKHHQYKSSKRNEKSVPKTK